MSYFVPQYSTYKKSGVLPPTSTTGILPLDTIGFFYPKSNLIRSLATMGCCSMGRAKSLVGWATMHLAPPIIGSNMDVFQ